MWNSLDQASFESPSNHLTEQKLDLFLIEAENTDPIYLILLQINTDSISQLEFQLMIITLAITANRTLDQFIDEIQSMQSMVFHKMSAQKTKQNNTAGFQSVSNICCLNPNINNTETIESTHSTEFNLISLPTTSTLIPEVDTPLQVPTEFFRSKTNIYRCQNVYQKFTSQTIATSDHFHF